MFFTAHLLASAHLVRIKFADSLTKLRGTVVAQTQVHDCVTDPRIETFPDCLVLVLS